MSDTFATTHLLDGRYELQAQLRELLSRLHDMDFVERHSLSIRLVATLPPSREAIGVLIREHLIKTIQLLKPTYNIDPYADPWRQYIILQDRYVLQKSLREIEDRLSLGERQMRRAHQNAIASLASLLAPSLDKVERTDTSPTSTIAVWTEAVQRLSPVPRVFGLQQLLQDIASATERTLYAFPTDARPKLSVTVQPPNLSVYTDRGILHQLLLKLTQFTIQHANHSGHLFSLTSMQDEGASQALAKVQLAAPALAQQMVNHETIRFCRSLASLLQAPLDIAFHAEDAMVCTLKIPVGTRLRKVLIVDDELPAAELFQSYLIGLQYETVIETNPEHAIVRAKQFVPDAIVLDIMMPGMDGWELLQRFRHTLGLADVPIIACSVINDVEMAAALGASFFLPKPVLRAHLIDALRQLLTD